MTYRGVNPDCEPCGGSGFVKLPEYDGPDTWSEERNCYCQEDDCDCGPCAQRRELQDTP